MARVWLADIAQEIDPLHRRSVRITAQRACWRKRPYAIEDEAIHAARKAQRKASAKGDDRPIHHYQCPHRRQENGLRHWHIGHVPRRFATQEGDA